MRLHDSLDFVAATRPNLDFAIESGRHLSYRDAASQAERVAQCLVETGLRAGDRAAVLAKNSIEYAVLYFAASKAEVVLVPVNYRLAPPEWSYILNDAGARILFAGQEYLTQIDMIRNELGTVGQFVCIDSDAPGWGWIGLCEWGSSETGAVADRIDRTDPDAVQMYTSGTTGKPKGVVLTQQSLISTFEACMPIGYGVLFAVRT